MKRRTIVVVPYDPRWTGQYEAEADRLASILGDELLASHHIGSTAVPGLAAKPIIDILLVVRSVFTLDGYNERLRLAGYIAKGENGIPGRRYFLKGSTVERSHHVHAFEAAHPGVQRHLDFRDFLRAHPEACAGYGELKSTLARRHPHDIEAYMQGKETLILDILARAARWRVEAGGNSLAAGPAARP
jgi:GrpB-like predicted nucleotidyltransferase (UPF0157 family)